MKLILNGEMQAANKHGNHYKNGSACENALIITNESSEERIVYFVSQTKNVQNRTEIIGAGETVKLKPAPQEFNDYLFNVYVEYENASDIFLCVYKPVPEIKVIEHVKSTKKRVRKTARK